MLVARTVLRNELWNPKTEQGQTESDKPLVFPQLIYKHKCIPRQNLRLVKDEKAIVCVYYYSLFKIKVRIELKCTNKHGWNAKCEQFTIIP